MKFRMFLGIMTAAILAVCCFSFTACDDEKAYMGATDAHSVYAIGAVTSAKLLEMTDVSNIALAADIDSEIGNDVEDFNRYFNMLDSFLDSSDIKTEDSANHDSGYDFERKLVITGKNAEGASISHTFYYTQKLEDATSDTHRDDDDTVTVTRNIYSMTGAIAINGEDGTADMYDITGRRIIEVKEEGRELEKTETFNMRAVAASGNGNYVEVTHINQTEAEGQETEEESKYIYKLYNADRTLIEQTEIEFETEEDAGEVEAEYSIRFVSGASRGFYEIERETERGRTEIGVKYNIDGKSGRFTIVKGSDGYVYKFSDNNSHTYRDYRD